MPGLVSIIIPVHNATGFIQETINSCLQQSYSDLELILVENGSTDGSWSVIDSINDKRIRPFQLKIGNAAAARNYGFEKSRGDYIMFLDADDVLATNKIEKQIKALQKKPHGWIASCAWAKFTDNMQQAKIEEQAVWKIQSPLDWCVNALDGKGMMIPGCWLIPKSIIKKSGLWDETLTLHDDGEFMLRVLLASKGNVFVDGTVVYYRQVPGSLSRKNKNLKAAKSAYSVAKSYEEHLLKFKYSREVRRVLAKNYCQFIYEYHPKHSTLIKKAKIRLQQLNIKPLPLVGSEKFKWLTKCFGFYNSLKIVAIARTFKY